MCFGFFCSDYLGEQALLSSSRRGATVKVTSEMLYCLTADEKTFRECLQQNSHVKFAKRTENLNTQRNAVLTTVGKPDHEEKVCSEIENKS